MKSKGVLLFAFSTQEIDYLKIAEKNNTIYGILDTKEHLSQLQALKGDYKNKEFIYNYFNH